MGSLIELYFQAQRLLHMICYPDRPLSTEASMDQKAMITNILEVSPSKQHKSRNFDIYVFRRYEKRHLIHFLFQNLELWTLRVSWLDMQLMLKQFAPGSSELNQWLDTVAKAAINLFNLNSSNK